MRYPAAEKLEIIRLVEGSHLPVRRTLARIDVPVTTFYRWYDRYREHGPTGLEDRSPRPSRVWNRIPEPVRERLLALALEAPELSARELAVRFTDREKYFVSEASVYRLLKAHDLITSPAFTVVKAAEASRTRRARRTSSGRPTSPTSRSSAGAGSTSRRSSTTTRASSSPGSSAPPCASAT